MPDERGMQLNVGRKPAFSLAQVTLAYMYSLYIFSDILYFIQFDHENVYMQAIGQTHRSDQFYYLDQLN